MTNMIGIESCLFLKPKVLAYFNNLDSLYAHSSCQVSEYQLYLFFFFRFQIITFLCLPV